MKKVWYAPNKFESYGEQEIQAVVECLRSGWLAGFGPKSVEFEARTWKEALGLLHKPLAMACGVPDFKSRSHIDRAAQVLTSML